MDEFYFDRGYICFFLTLRKEKRSKARSRPKLIRVIVIRLLRLLNNVNPSRISYSELRFMNFEGNKKLFGLRWGRTGQVFTCRRSISRG